MSGPMATRKASVISALLGACVRDARGFLPKVHTSYTQVFPVRDSFQVPIMKLNPSDFLSSSDVTMANPATFAVLYGAGLLSSASPCSLSVLPVTVAYLSNEAKATAGGIAAAAVSYALGMSASMAGLGVTAIAAGELWGTVAQRNAILPSAAALFAVSAGLVLLDCISMDMSIKVPRFEHSDLSRNVPVLARAFAFGATSAFLSSPCSTPVLASILGFVASSHQPLPGVALLFAFTAGLTTPVCAAGAVGVTVMRNVADSASGAWGEAPASILGSGLVAYGTYSLLDNALSLLN